MNEGLLGPLRSLNGPKYTDNFPYESTHSFDQFCLSTVEDPTQLLPHTTGLKSNVHDPFWGVPKDDVSTEADSEWLSSPHLEAFDPNHEEYIAGQPELTEESGQRLTLSPFDLWLQPDVGFAVDVDFAQDYGFDYSNRPSFSLSDPPLTVQAPTAIIPGSFAGASSGSINSSTAGSPLSSPSPFTSGSSSSTNLSPSLTPVLTAPPGSTPSLGGAPQALQPERALECPDCRKKLSCARLRNHQCNTKRFWCHFGDCIEGFTSQKDLKRHQQTVHADKILAPSELRACPVCPYTARRKDHLQRHARSHQNGRKKRAKREERDSVTSVSSRKE